MLIIFFVLAAVCALPFAAVERDALPLALDFSILRDFSPKSGFWDLSFFRELKPETLGKRYLSTTLTNNNNVNYWLDIYLGPERQKITVSLDTGLADLWVYGPNISNTQGGTFDPIETGSQPLNENFSIAYLDGTGVIGKFYLDDFSLHRLRPLLRNLQFAVVDQAKFSGVSILGISSREVQTTSNKYDSLPFALQRAGITPKASYSLFLGGQSGKKGTIIFGGIDRAKYEGQLVTYPIPEDEEALSLNVVSATIDGNVYSETTRYLLDSGTSWNLLPQQLYDNIVQALKAENAGGIHVADCYQPTNKFLEFDFGHNVIKLSYKDLLVPYNGTCLVGAQPHKTAFILGDIFLRKAYVYYDLTDREISIAQYRASFSSSVISALHLFFSLRFLFN